MEAITAAHPTLPMPSYVRVTNLANKRSLIVRVNDRGPFHGNRVIDLSHKTAELLDFKDNGVARVRVEYVGRAALEGSDDRRLAATLRHGEPAPAPILVASAGNAADRAARNRRAASPWADRFRFPRGGRTISASRSRRRLTDVTAVRPSRATGASGRVSADGRSAL